jgi:hypothetical protein
LEDGPAIDGSIDGSMVGVWSDPPAGITAVIFLPFTTTTPVPVMARSAASPHGHHRDVGRRTAISLSEKYQNEEAANETALRLRRDVASPAMEVGAVLGLDGLETVRDNPR